MARARLVIVCTGARTRPAKSQPTPTETAAVSSRPIADHHSRPSRVSSTPSARALTITVSPNGRSRRRGQVPLSAAGRPAVHVLMKNVAFGAG